MYGQVDALFVFTMIFSYVWIWLTFWLDDINAKSPYYKNIYSEMLRSPILWLNVIMAVAIMIVPCYAFFKYRQLFGGNPIFDITYRHKWLAKRSSVVPSENAAPHPISTLVTANNEMD